MNLNEARSRLRDDFPDVVGVWLYDDGEVPVNCTIPELLRDLFGFSVQEGGHISALAFAVEEIGASRYNSGQASLRRACERLKTRRLINTRSGQFGGSVSIFSHDVYRRTGIGLTEAGVAAADMLMQAPLAPKKTPKQDITLSSKTKAPAAMPAAGVP